MEIVLNEYSFDGQFTDSEEFLQYFRKDIKIVMEYLYNHNYPLLKRFEAYDLQITPEEKLQDILYLGGGDPLVYIIKKYISQMAYNEPFWDSDSKTKENVTYICPKMEEIPNCFTEAIERDRIILSIKHKEYMDKDILFERDGEYGIIDNIITYPIFLKILLQREKDIKYVFENYPFQREIKFFEENGKCYALDALQEKSLSINDRCIILENIERLIEGLNNGQKNRFWDLIEKGLYEYRVSISENREFRLFFVQMKAICFLNGYIHKSKKTPDHIKVIARELKGKLER